MTFQAFDEVNPPMMIEMVIHLNQVEIMMISIYSVRKGKFEKVCSFYVYTINRFVRNCMDRFFFRYASNGQWLIGKFDMYEFNMIVANMLSI